MACRVRLARVTPSIIMLPIQVGAGVMMVVVHVLCTMYMCMSVHGNARGMVGSATHVHVHVVFDVVIMGSGKG